MDEENNNTQGQQQPQQPNVSQAIDAAQDLNQIRATRRERAAKKAENVVKTASKTTRLSNIAAKLIIFLKYIAFILIFIIILIGIITFLLTGMGLIWSGISDIVEDVADWWRSITDGEETIVKYDTIQDTMNYLYSMDYDLYGFGFVTRPDTSIDSYSGWTIKNNDDDEDEEPDKSGNEEPNNNSNEDSGVGQGHIEVDEDTYNILSKGDYKSNPYRYLQVYAISDNYANLIKNNNKNFEKIFSGGVITGMKDFFKGIFGDKTEWGTGLLSVYYEKLDKDNNNKPIVGMRGNDVSGFESTITGTVNVVANTITNAIGVTDDQATAYYNDAHVKVSNGKLVVSSGAANNIKFRYNLDGWVGRYGMPLEFLLSVHLATMAPDLSYRLATSFDTDVEILLRKSDDSSVVAGVVQKNKENITSTLNLKESDDYKDMTPEEQEKAEVIITAVDIDNALTNPDYGKFSGNKLYDMKQNGEDIFFNLSKSDVMDIFEHSPLVSPESCLGAGESWSFTYDTASENTDGYGVEITSDETTLNSVDRNKVGSKDSNDYHVLDDVTNVRQTILALVIKGLNDAIDSGVIKQENGLTEIDMEKYALQGVDETEYADTQAGIIIGDANKTYSIMKLDDAKYYTDVPTISADAGGFEQGSISGVGSYPVQEYIKKKIYEEIGSDKLVELKKLSFVNENPIKDDIDEYAREYNTSKYNGSVNNEYNNSKFEVTAQLVNQGYFRVENFLVSEFLEMLNGDGHSYFEYNSNRGYDPYYYYLRDIYWGFHQGFFNGDNSRDIRVGVNWNNNTVKIDDKKIDNEVYKNPHKEGTETIHYFDPDSFGNEDVETQDINKTFFAWIEDSLSEYKYEVKVNDGKKYTDKTSYNFKQYENDEKEKVNIQKKYYSTSTNNAAISIDDLKKKFRPLTMENYDIKNTNKTVNITYDQPYVPKFKDYNTAEFTTHEAYYPGRDVTAEAYKPILKNNDSTWNFSFVNVSENPDDNGNGGCHTFITISISTSPVSGEAEQAHLDKLNKDGDEYIVNYTNYNIGNVSVKITARKISDSELKSGSSTAKEDRCSYLAKNDPSKDKVCCDICYNYVKEVYKTLKSMTELKMTTYVPYINRVADHWYRNIYFTPNAIKDYNENFVDKYNSNLSEDEEDKKLKKEENIIQVDEKYAINTGERWTKYETYTDDDGNEQYKLYVYKEDENGNYELGNDWVKVVETNDGNYNLKEDKNTYKFVGNEKGKYNLIKEDGSLYVDYQDEIRLGKKATDLTAVSDILAGPTDEKPDIWTGAYSDNHTKVKTDWQILDPDNEDLEEMDSEMKKILTEYQDITVVSSQEYESVEQVEDGIRGETNSKIKKIFLDDYYIYDGTTERASIIQLFKNQYGDDPTVVPAESSYTSAYGSKISTAKIGDVSGKINITKDSLNAFAILKNMKTLDAEYIYHDFKELIVELNYFDKEDLRENVQQVMMFPIAGINSKNWPVGGIDKFPTYYGTLIHSKADYEYLLNEQEVKQQLHEVDLKNTSGKNSDPKIERTGEGSDKKFHKDTFYETAQACWEHIVAAKNYTYNENQGNVPATNIANMNDRLFVSWVLYEYGYEDCIGTPKDYGFFNTSNRPKEDYGFIVNSYGDNEDFRDELNRGDIVSFGASQGTSGGHVAIIASITEDGDNGKIIKAYDCSKAINWTLSNRVSGVDITNLVKAGGARVIRVDQNPVLNYDYGFEGGEPVVAPASGLVIDYGTTKRTNKETGKEDEEVGYIKIKLLDDTDTSFVEKEKIANGKGDSASVFLSSNYSKEDLKVLGYDYFEEEYKDAGISGNILYIEGFDIKEVLEKGAKTDDSGSNSGVTYKLGDYTDANGTVYHNVALDENGNVVRGGGGGNYIFDNSLISSQSVKGSTKKTTKATGENSATITSNKEHVKNIKLLKNYVQKYASNRYSTQYQVPSLQDKKSEFNIKVKEEAKKQASYAVDIDGRIYIKEGAIIGYTYPEDNEFSEKRDLREVKDDGTIETNEGAGSVGNYLRVILRDLDDEVVENVEEYMETADNKPKFKITEQFKYWMAFTSEGALVANGDTNYYLSEDIGDGVGNSGPFGLTVYCDGIASNAGYPEFGNHRNDGKVPLTEGEDVFAAVLETERQAVYDGLEKRDLLKRTSDYMFLALVDLSHAGPVMLNQQLDKFKNQGYLTRKDFQDNWGTAEAFAGGLKGRAVRRGILALDELYTAGNLDGFYEVVWLSNQPWTDYQKKHDNNGSVFGGSAIRLVTYTPNSEQFDLSKKNSN